MQQRTEYLNKQELREYHERNAHPLHPRLYDITREYQHQVNKDGN
jgi:hypothetical protein